MRNSVTSILAKKAYLSISIALGVMTSAQADDIDVYTQQVGANAKSNILFVLDYSGSMAHTINGVRKINTLKSAMRTVLNDNVDSINAGIGSLYNHDTTGIRWPISELNADASTVDPDIPIGTFTVRDIIDQEVHSRSAGGGTAIVDALVEAAQYFRGDAVTHNDASLLPANRHQPYRWNLSTSEYSGGTRRAANANSYSPSNAFSTDIGQTYNCNDFSPSGGPNYCENKITSNCVTMQPSDSPTVGYERLNNLWGSYQRCDYTRSQAWEGARYNSPITTSCQANAIILLSDGEPTHLNNGASLRSIVGSNAASCADTFFPSGRCGPELAFSLANNDQNPLVPGSVVKTYTVGFDVQGATANYMSLLAASGDGSYFSVTRPEELTEALNTIVGEVLGGSESFAGLSVDVDRANFSHDNRVFFGLFSPDVRRAWSGNLKGYFVDESGLIDINGNNATVESEGATQFSETAQSFWSPSIDGNEVEAGGASAQLANSNRNLYTYTSDVIPDGGLVLASSNNNELTAANTQITTALMELPSGSALRGTALNWIQQAPMGDPLHSKSVEMNYGTRKVTYLMTNQGLIHAIDSSSPTETGAGDSSGGEELFAFMPKRLLANLPDLYENANTGDHIYGLDGQITRWHTDTNNDGIVNNNERALLVFGMRRGGKAYYALDVSNPTSPNLKWVIDENNASFPNLAQTWSRMSLIQVRNGGNEEHVLAFAGGYDADIQDPVNGAASSQGNAIYMIDDNGDLLWSVDQRNNPLMQYSIASDLSIIDSDSDGLADRIYVGDLGGQVWRIDFDDIEAAPDVTRLANLDNGIHQPIFYPPSVSLYKGNSGQFLSISLGTGNRTNPLLENSQNNLYMIRDTDVEKGPPSSDFSTIEANDLYDATNNNISSSDSTTAEEAREALDNARGWFIALSDNEKSLSSLVTFEGRLMATTFDTDTDTNADADSDSCSSASNTNRFYIMNVGNAAAEGIDGNSLSEPEDTNTSRSYNLHSAGIPSSPVVVFTKGSTGAVQVIVDKTSISLLDKKLARIFWHAR